MKSPGLGQSKILPSGLKELFLKIHSDTETYYTVIIILFASGSKAPSADPGNKGLNEATRKHLECKELSHDLANGHLVCNGIKINSTCWTLCIKGYEKKYVQAGNYRCVENGEWDGEGTSCVKKDCGVLQKVRKTY